MHNPIMIVGIGEILWDLLGEKEELGGAPVNFAYHVNALGGIGVPISTVGDDDRGRRALAELVARKLSTEFIASSQVFETGYVRASVDAEGVPSYEFPSDVAWDHLVIDDDQFALTSSLQGVCFGTLAQRSATSRRAIHAFIDRLAPGVLRICDLNLRQEFYNRAVVEASMDRADMLKLNEEELIVLQQMLGLPGESRSALAELAAKYGLRLAVLTRGEKGSLLLTPAAYSEHSGFPSRVVDTIGAGDALTAATALGFLLGHDLDRINAHANRLAAYICTQKGAMPPVPSEFRLV